MSIRTRIILLTVMPVLVCILFAESSFAVVSRQTATENMEQLSENLGVAYGEVLSQSIGNLATQVEAIAREAQLFDTDSSDQEKVKALQRHAQNTDVTNLGVFGPDGKNLFIGYADGTTVPPGVADVSQRPYLKEALAGNTVVFGPSKDVVSGRLTITIATPVNVPGAPKAIAAIDFDLDLIDDIVSGVSFGRTGHGFLVDRNGMFISAQSQDWIGKTYQELGAQGAGVGQAVAAALQSESGNVSYNHNGAGCYATFRPIQGSDGWRLVTATETGEYMAAFVNTVKFQAVILVVYLLLVGLFALYCGRNIANPIHFASQRARALAQGDLTPIDYPKGAARKDEGGELIRSLSEAVAELTVYIGDISGKLSAMAEGNLNQEVTQDYRGDFAPIKGSLTTILESFNNMLMEIDQTADQVAGGSSQVADGAQALAQGSTEQAGSTEHIVGSMETSLEQMNRAAAEATQALEQTGKSNDALVGARDYMNRMLESMSAISESSESIGKIIKSIDDIAFQTNILALNAAVEAARAGQHGKGFAVVADEVRNLAAKSAEAAKETSELIERSIQAVSGGMAIATETAREIESTAKGAELVGELIRDVERVVGEQAQAFVKISEAVDQIATVTQTNSATAEESAAASEELSSQAQMLKVLVSRIQLKKKPASLSAAPALAPPAAPDMLYSEESYGQSHQPPQEQAYRNFSQPQDQYGDKYDTGMYLEG